MTPLRLRLDLIDTDYPTESRLLVYGSLQRPDGSRRRPTRWIVSLDKPLDEQQSQVGRFLADLPPVQRPISELIVEPEPPLLPWAQSARLRVRLHRKEGVSAAVMVRRTSTDGDLPAGNLVLLCAAHLSDWPHFEAMVHAMVSAGIAAEDAWRIANSLADLQIGVQQFQDSLGELALQGALGVDQVRWLRRVADSDIRAPLERILEAQGKRQHGSRH